MVGVGVGVLRARRGALGVAVSVAKSAERVRPEPPVNPVKATAPTPARTSSAAPPRATGARSGELPSGARSPCPARRGGVVAE
ncbi:hypothetical protein QJS66_04890 [Kocuria rhizophila]|nr:hypothetical protein QJS66_04890 [Kocuria rhizophila]